MQIATLTMNPALDVTTDTPALIAGHKLRCAPPSEEAGGGGVNVARAIQALGGTALAILPSGGSAGTRLCALLGEAQVPFRAIPIAGTTRESFTVDEVSTGRQYRFVLPGPHLNEADYTRCLEAITALEPAPGWLVASGSLPPGCPDSFFLMLGGLCRSLGTELLLDSSGRALSRCDGLDAFLVKPSLKELEALAGRPLIDEASQVDAAQTLLDRGFARAILVSLGARGALLVTQRLSHRYTAPKVEICSTVGAGDSMVAAVTLALSRCIPLEEAVRHGVAAGAAALTTRGTALAHRDEAARLLGQVSASPARRKHRLSLADS